MHICIFIYVHAFIKYTRIHTFMHILCISTCMYIKIYKSVYVCMHVLNVSAYSSMNIGCLEIGVMQNKVYHNKQVETSSIAEDC